MAGLTQTPVRGDGEVVPEHAVGSRQAVRTDAMVDAGPDGAPQHRASQPATGAAVEPAVEQRHTFDRVVARVGNLTAVPAAAVGTAEIRRQRRAAAASRRAGGRSRWWFVFVLLTAVAASGYVVLRTDQQVSAIVVWPTAGSQFVEWGGSVDDPDYRSTMTIVAAGLNRKSGNLVAAALSPSLTGPDARVFSLVYGSGIYDEDVEAKFDALFQRYQPRRLVLFGNSMGGDVLLNIAGHFQQRFADPRQYPPGHLMPQIDTIYLDCTPMGAADVRSAARARADFLTGLSEAVGTDGGAVTRLAAELLVQRKQWSTGRYPFLRVDGHRFAYKWSEVWREKLNPTGVSTALVRDQYGVIRRFDAARVLGRLPSGTDLVYLRPEVGADDNTVNVDQVETVLTRLAKADDLDLRVIDIPGGSHASAIRDADRYNAAMLAHQRDAIRSRVVELFR